MKRIFVSLLLISTPSFAEMMCDYATNYYAIYEPNSYTCNPGQYLPANTLGCVSCPNGFSCNGGTYNFNPNFYQGAILNTITTNTMNNICADNFPIDLFAAYEPNQYTCSPGYYLPANVDSCTECPRNNKCIGGTYSFNETTSQGIEPCPNENKFAPTGSAVCYPHILHIGENNIYLKSTPTTSPALNIDFNNDGIADLFANMTTTPTYMNKDSEQSLKIMVNGIEYHVCDDTICPQ